MTVLTQGASIAVALVATPVILAGIGLGAFGVWTVAVAVASYVTTLGGGLGAGLQRFTAFAAAQEEPAAAGRVVWTGLVAFLAIGAVVATLAQLLAPTLVSIFSVERSVEADAATMWRVMGGSIGLALVASFLGNVQHGLERFSRFARDQSLALVVYLGAIVFAIESGKGLPGLASASLTYHALLVALRMWSLRDIVNPLRPRLGTRSLVRELARFSAVLQISMVGNLINLQSDRIIAGLVAAPSVVGQLGIGSQVAVALRLVAGSAISPVLTRLSMTHGSGGSDRLLAEFRQINRIWTLTVVGCAIVVAASLVPLLETWVGPGHEEAAGFGALLIFAYSVNLLAAPGTSLLAATGRPQVEARYTVMTAVLNIGASIGLGLLFGVIGIVAATAGAYVVGTSWFLSELRRFAPWAPKNPGRLAVRVASRAILPAAAGYGWCWLVKELLPSGIGVVPAGLGVGACILLYLRLVNVAPKLALLRPQRATTR